MWIVHDCTDEAGSGRVVCAMRRTSPPSPDEDAFFAARGLAVLEVDDGDHDALYVERGPDGVRARPRPALPALPATVGVGETVTIETPRPATVTIDGVTHAEDGGRMAIQFHDVGVYRVRVEAWPALPAVGEVTCR